jgi:hypothetical protein
MRPKIISILLVFSSLVIFNSCCANKDEKTSPIDPVVNNNDTVINESDYIKTELYIGLVGLDEDFPEEKWMDFKTNKLEHLIDGYTEVKGFGFWRNNQDSATYQQSNILIYLHKDTETEDALIQLVIDEIKTDFNQESVVRVDQKVEVAF